MKDVKQTTDGAAPPPLTVAKDEETSTAAAVVTVKQEIPDDGVVVDKEGLFLFHLCFLCLFFWFLLF